MHKIIYEPILPVNQAVSRYEQTNQILIPSDSKIDGLFISLTEKGLNSLTDKKIEHIICTSALAAFY